LDKNFHVKFELLSLCCVEHLSRIFTG
jgi:hypothetical protein